MIEKQQVALTNENVELVSSLVEKMDELEQVPSVPKTTKKDFVNRARREVHIDILGHTNPNPDPNPDPPTRWCVWTTRSTEKCFGTSSKPEKKRTRPISRCSRNAPSFLRLKSGRNS